MNDHPRPRPAALWTQRLIALALLVALAGVTAGLMAWAIEAFGVYGWGLFVGLPFSVGAVATWLVLAVGVEHRPLQAVLLGVTPLLIGGFLLVMGIEGVICIVMAAPLWVAVFGVGVVFGGIVWALVQAMRWRALALLMTLSISPAMFGLESAIEPTPPVYRVSTALVVDAPPERVWRHVIAFAELPEPDEFLFRHGIAYPVRAEIEGEGVGAIRRCVFSTGAFIEPITAWQPPNLLAFDVISNPPALEEWSPVGQIHPPHTHGYFISHRGQFELRAMEGGRTRLIGTTWYQHGLWPASYWRPWSDHIIHRIHRRVLVHIQQRAEAEGT